MSSRVRIGHIYSPPTGGKDATMFDWFSNSQHAVQTLQGTFLKVAHVLPSQAIASTLDPATLYESVYMDMREQPNPPPFTVPNGWAQLCVYTDDDLVTRPVIH
ncbi:hypothetical protein CY34DRAFT_17017, partial [Suillus luteus UH-Slu-Lm8-n1]